MGRFQEDELFPAQRLLLGFGVYKAEKYTEETE